jgi:hypothetical protein
LDHASREYEPLPLFISATLRLLALPTLALKIV